MKLDYAQLSALAAILRLGSFEAAAAELGVTPSAVSQRLKALEERVGTTLVRRGQPCTGTDAGRRLAAHADAVRLLESQLGRDLDGLVPSASAPRLRLAANADSLATWLVPALAKQPDLQFDVVVDDQDHSLDWLARGEVAAAVTSHAAPVAGCDSFALGNLRYIPTATPEFMSRWFPQGVTAESLSQAPMLRFNRKDALQARWIGTVSDSPLSPPTHHIASSSGFVKGALSGLGWAMNPELMVRADLLSGRLVSLLPDAHLDVPLFWQVNRIVAPAVETLTRAIRREAVAQLVATAPAA